MFGLGMGELVIILCIVIIVFGASKLPQIGAGLGKGISNFKKEVKPEEKIIESQDESKEKKEDQSV